MHVDLPCPAVARAIGWVVVAAAAAACFYWRPRWGWEVGRKRRGGRDRKAKEEVACVEEHAVQAHVGPLMEARAQGDDEGRGAREPGRHRCDAPP